MRTSIKHRRPALDFRFFPWVHQFVFLCFILLNANICAQHFTVSDSATTVLIQNTFNGAAAIHGLKTFVSGSPTNFRYGHLIEVFGGGTVPTDGVRVSISGDSDAPQMGTANSLFTSSTGIRIGTNNTLYGTGTGDRYGTRQWIISDRDGNNYGCTTELYGSGNGFQTGVRNIINTTGHGIHYGMFNEILKTGNGTTYGVNNTISNTGTGLTYGTYNSIDQTGSGTHIGGYFAAPGPTNYAAIFESGHVVVNNVAGNYDLTIKGTTKPALFFADASAGKVGIGSSAPSDALHIVATGTEDLFRVQLGTATKMRIFNNGSISLGTNNTAIDAGDVYIHNELGIKRSNPSFPIHIGTNGTNGNGAHVTTGGTWTNGSSRAFKENFVSVDANEILQKLAALDILQWSYKESNEGMHLGPMAEDFHTAFGLGHDPHYISTVDADGVALAAIQALYEKVIESNEVIALLGERLNEQEILIRQLQSLCEQQKHCQNRAKSNQEQEH